MTLRIITHARPADSQQPAQVENFFGHKTINKLAADIGFLKERIALVNSYRHPNPAVLQTYTVMLARREAALALLREKKSGGTAE